MSAYQCFLKNVLFPLDAIRSGKSKLFAYLREFEKTQFLSPEEIQELNWQRLKRILAHAYDNIPYYHKSFDAAGVHPNDVKEEKDLLRLPVLEKKQVQDHLAELYVPNWPSKDLITDQTGGSTGTPVKYYCSYDRRISREAATYRHNRWAGWDICDKAATLWGAYRDIVPPKTMLNKIHAFLLGRSINLNTAAFNENDVFLFNDEMKKFRPKCILGYANALAIFARILKDHAVSAYQPYSIVASSEMLTTENRLLVEEVFGCKVFNRYGSRETSVLASECEKHEGMHVMAEGLHIELVRQGRHTEPEEMGEVIVTDMLNLPMPLIRYRIGDTASWSGKICSCGRGLPMLSGLNGRVSDFLVTDSGGLSSGTALTAMIVSTRTSLKQVQIYQEKQGEVVFRLATGKDTPAAKEDLDFVREKAAVYLGKGTKVDFEFVDEIPKTASGKYLFSISKAVADEFRASDVHSE